jgi:peptide/nickel transport system substrate-binding protein
VSAHGGLDSPVSRRAALGLMAGTALTVVLPACGSGSGGAAAGSGGGGGNATLRMVGDQVITNLDPRTSLGPDGVVIRRNMFKTITLFNSANGDVTPLFAAELPQQVDATTWLLKVAPGQQWQDGSKVTATDVKYTIDWMQNARNGSLFGTAVLDVVKSVEVVDPSTVRLHLTRSSGSLLERLSAIAPVPKAVAERVGPKRFKIQPLGLGPFAFEGFAADQHETLKRWEQYPLEPKAQVAHADLQRIVEGSARINALQGGQADVDINVDPDLFPVVSGSGLKGAKHAGAGYNAILLNTGIKPFDDQRVRLAVAHAIDRDELAKAVWNGLAQPQVGPLPPWHYMAADVRAPAHDPDKAKALLRAAGHTSPLEFELMQGIYSTGLTMATVLQKQLEAAGFKVRIKTGDAEGLYQYVFNKTWQGFSMRGNTSIIGGYADLYARWTSQAIFNNAPASELAPIVKGLEKADAIPSHDLGARKAAYAALQQTIVDQARIVYLVNPSVLTASVKSVQGMTFGPDGVPNTLTSVTVAA